VASKDSRTGFAQVKVAVPLWERVPCVLVLSPEPIKNPAFAGFFSYFAAISAVVMSSMRLEKPHSLSYHERTFTRVPPMTRVWVAS
jgi:hypothetical protein